MSCLERRSLYDVNLVVLFLDAIYFPVRPSGPKEGVLRHTRTAPRPQGDSQASITDSRRRSSLLLSQLRPPADHRASGYHPPIADLRLVAPLAQDSNVSTPASLGTST